MTDEQGVPQESAPLKRPPGRPKGTPKTGGRQKGTPNRSTVQTRERIRKLADPIGFLADVMDGKRMSAAGESGDAKKTWCYPTLAQRVQASETLLKKLLPDLRATELTGDLRPVLKAVEYRIVDARGKPTEPAQPAQVPACDNSGVEPERAESGAEVVRPEFREGRSK